VAPKEFVERELGVSGQKVRIDRARLELFKSMLDRGGKGNDSIVKCWGGDSGWLRKVKISLGRFGICENGDG